LGIVPLRQAVKMSFSTSSFDTLVYGSDPNVKRFHDHLPVVHDAPYSWLLPSVAILLYFALLLVGPRLVKYPWSLDLPLRYWNLLLTILSFLMFLGLAIPSLRYFISSGYSIVTLLTIWPSTPHFNVFTVWVFGFTKYLELIDTVFLILRKRPLSFLHWYHHTTVLLYTWYAVYLQIPCGIQFATVNCFVHTIMYGYYYLASIGHRPSWGQYVTQIQLAQMLVGFLLMATWAKYYFLDDQNYGTPHLYGGRHHAIIVTAAGMIMYFSYFLLFVQFYVNRFLSTKKDSSTDKKKDSSTDEKKDSPADKKKN